MSEAFQPVVTELPSHWTAVEVFRRWQHQPHCVFFDSAMPHATLGRYSFVACDPFEWIELPADGSDALGVLAAKLSRYTAKPIAGLPPLQGGAAGLLSYDLCHSLEKLPKPQHDEFKVPALAMGLYDVVAAFDHQTGQGWLVSQGFPSTESSERPQRATSRAQQFLELLETTVPPPPAKSAEIPIGELAPQFDVGDGITSDFSRDDYLRAVARGVEYIHAGDIFQVNLSQRLMVPAEGSARELYERLRTRNAAPFAGYFDLGNYQLASASPERFLRVVGRHVETRPIKGTRPLTSRPEADLFAGDELTRSEKDRAENVMIVDLLRNDLSQVCLPHSVQVTKLCGLETYAYVQHLVSAVEGELQPEKTAVDLLRASFPGGSITGAPKVRAMEIIAELEPTARGAYCGSLAYIGFDGTMDSNLLIRTITAGKGWWQLPAGGGIVAASDPRREYEETWHKAHGMLKARQA
ncbi:anthranilate synthase component I family protein [Aeoliella mucimassa]|uniref:Aminodeoxychorismate synthase component 1 n=1 Tax=Aeoliella mucimassa TaxID=2527972 RepID=A0A518AK73_9BACT|nr:anthranilate synthase component I family protein [Aeoliella mucimassa]QDU55131.1 Aminodeoxychorismate synthase component 1 [Aeoliella mucimassa]